VDDLLAISSQVIVIAPWPWLGIEDYKNKSNDGFFKIST
jgi:hypothetical protein